MFKSNLINYVIFLSILFTAIKAESPMFLYAGAGTPAFTAPPYTPSGTTTALQGYTTVLAWSWGLSTTGTSQKAAAKANFQDISFTRYNDANSNTLALALVKGTHFAILNLVIYHQSGANYVVGKTLQLSEVVVTSYSTGGSGGEDTLTENVTLNFQKISIVFGPTASGTGPKFNWDIAQNVAF